MSAEQAAPQQEPSQTAPLPNATPDPASDTFTPATDVAPQPADENRKVLSSVQKRIDELTRAKYETERNAEARLQQWQRHAYELEQQVQRQNVQQNEPTLENSGNDFERYVSRKAQWEAGRMTQAMLAQQGQQANAQANYNAQLAQAQQQALAEQQFVQTKVQEGNKVYPDFAKAIANPDLPQLRDVNFPAYQAILESEKGIDVAYYLAKNPLVAHKVALLPPLAAVREIGKIEAMFASGRRVSGAPQPISTVGNAGGSSATGHSDKMSMDEWVKRREKQLRDQR